MEKVGTESLWSNQPVKGRSRLALRAGWVNGPQLCEWCGVGGHGDPQYADSEWYNSAGGEPACTETWFDSRTPPLLGDPRLNAPSGMYPAAGSSFELLAGGGSCYSPQFQVVSVRNREAGRPFFGR